MEPKSSRGFSLVELLVVMVVIGILAVVIFPTLSMIRTQAQTSKCLSNLRQLHAGCMMYAANNGGWLPPNEDDSGDGAWWKSIYPDYIDGPGVFMCPLDETGGISEANADLANNGKLSYGAMGNADPAVRQSVMDKNLGDFVRADRCLMLIDDPKSARQLAKSWFYNWPRWTSDLQSGMHDGKLNMVFVDGHVDSLTKEEILEGQSEGTLKVSYGNMNSRSSKTTN